MLDLIERQELIKNLNIFAPEHYTALINNLICKQPTFDLDKVVGQIMWERDIAIKQLEDYGVGFGEKAELQRVRHGKWFDVGSLFCRCDQCGCKNNKETPYCPNCGAKMESE